MQPDARPIDAVPLQPPPGPGLDRWEVPTRSEACLVLCGSSAVRLPEVRQLPGTGERPAAMPAGSLGDTRLGWAPSSAPVSDPSELPLPELLKEQWRPLDMLGKCLSPGTILCRERDGQYVLQAAGACLASAPTLDALAYQLLGLRPGQRINLKVRVKRRLLDSVHSVINQGETLTAFVLEALEHEILRRRAEDAGEDQP